MGRLVAIGKSPLGVVGFPPFHQLAFPITHSRPQELLISNVGLFSLSCEISLVSGIWYRYWDRVFGLSNQQTLHNPRNYVCILWINFTQSSSFCVENCTLTWKSSPAPLLIWWWEVSKVRRQKSGPSRFSYFSVWGNISFIVNPPPPHLPTGWPTGPE